MKEIFLDPNRRFGDVSNRELIPWFTAKLTDLYQKCGRKNFDAPTDSLEFIAELREKAQYRTIPVGFIGRCFKGIINGEYEELNETKRITFQNILIALNREARQHLPQGSNLNFESTKKDYNRMFANAVNGNDPIAKGSAWAVKLSCSKLTSRGMIAHQRGVVGVMAAACYLAGIAPDELLEGSDEDFLKLQVRLEPYVQKVEARIQQSKERSQAARYPRPDSAGGTQIAR